jgi:hypothetical protein
LDLSVDLLDQYLQGNQSPVQGRLVHFFPADLLQDISGKAVLCLASSRGQQSAVFGLLGAQVTVVDFKGAIGRGRGGMYQTSVQSTSRLPGS